MQKPPPVSLLVQRLLALFAGGVLLFNFPLLQLWLTERTVWGLPLLPLALFSAWALLVGLLAWLMESRAKNDRGLEDPGDG